ncbi:capping complex subunit for YIEGIA [Cohnella terricola]|uniref:Uncharacterized protein n=1 Tax=Cohnella terricola TaxID=1289167 RepID=A0A559JXK6_9BACL|nr:hypothetical protein [Cohnella terricola]TVY04550.1 hypothetical protein FPZ45_02955 [Cohnella terricola]
MAKIVGVVTTKREYVGGGAPIIFARDEAHLQMIAHLLEKVMDCSAHSVDEELFIIVDHK